MKKFHVNLLKNYSLVFPSFFLACSPEPEDKSGSIYKFERKSLFERVEENGVLFEEEDIGKIKFFWDTLVLADGIKETIVESLTIEAKKFPDKKFSFNDVLKIYSDIVVDSWRKKSIINATSCGEF